MLKVSVIIPIYNRAQILPRTLDSFLKQTYTNWECILVDDHSTDNSMDVIRSFVEMDTRFKYCINNRTKGAQGARNTGISYASADWICFFDSDDYASLTFLEKMMSAIDDNIDIVTSYVNLIDTRTKKQKVLEWGGDGHLLNALLDGSTYVAFNMAIIKKLKLFQIGMLDEYCPAYQEYDTHIRLSQVSKYKSVKEPLSDYYFCSSDSISANPQKNNMGLLYIYTKHQSLWRKNRYFAYLKKTRDLFTIADHSIRKRLLRLVPELLIFYPLSRLKKKWISKT